MSASFSGRLAIAPASGRPGCRRTGSAGRWRRAPDDVGRVRAGSRRRRQRALGGAREATLASDSPGAIAAWVGGGTFRRALGPLGGSTRDGSATAGARSRSLEHGPARRQRRLAGQPQSSAWLEVGQARAARRAALGIPLVEDRLTGSRWIEGTRNHRPSAPPTTAPIIGHTKVVVVEDAADERQPEHRAEKATTTEPELLPPGAARQPLDGQRHPGESRRRARTGTSHRGPRRVTRRTMIADRPSPTILLVPAPYLIVSSSKATGSAIRNGSARAAIAREERRCTLGLVASRSRCSRHEHDERKRHERERAQDRRPPGRPPATEAAACDELEGEHSSREARGVVLPEPGRAPRDRVTDEQRARARATSRATAER